MAMEITFDRACLWSFGNHLASNVVIFVDSSSSKIFTLTVLMTAMLNGNKSLILILIKKF